MAEGRDKFSRVEKVAAIARAFASLSEEDAKTIASTTPRHMPAMAICVAERLLTEIEHDGYMLRPGVSFPNG